MPPRIHTKKSMKSTVSPQMRAILSRVVAFDGGNGKASLHRLDEKGRLHRRVIPHAKTRVTGHQVSLTWGKTVDVHYADYLGDRIGYGETIWDLAGDYQIDTFQNTPERYGSPDHIFYALTLMAEMGLPDGEWDVMVSVPPGLYDRVKQQVEVGFQNGQPRKQWVKVKRNRKEEEVEEITYDGWWEICLSKDRQKLRKYKFNRVIVVMEGWVGWAAYRFDLDGNVIEILDENGQDRLAGICEIGDAGFGTFDSPILRDGALVADSLRGASDGNGGIGARLCKPVLDKILERVPNANLTIAHVDKMLRDYATGRDGKVTIWSAEAATVEVSGYRLELKRTFDYYIEQYATWMWQSKVVPAMRRNTDVYLADGGGWLYSVESIRQWSKGKISVVTPTDVEHMKQYNYFELNGVGMLAFAAANIREHLTE
jgi:hypothetical protein